MSNRHTYPALSFIIPIENGDDLITERINIAFQFLKRYKGSGEIIAISDGAANGVYKLAWLTIKLNKTNAPHVRTAMMLHTTQLGLTEIIKTGLSRALGEKVIVLLNPIRHEKKPEIENLKELFKGLEITGSLANLETPKID